ncbi:MAG: RNA methyltransferase [Lachnospiraceae bacterium]|nr:RNA methyltransferase [Lachnospiraceae bacterium]
MNSYNMKSYNTINITDMNSPELAIYSCRSEVQLLRYYEPNPGIFIAESPKVVMRALEAGYEPISLLMEEKHVQGEGQPVINMCGQIPIYVAPFDVLTKLTGFQLTRGLLCAMRRKKLPSPEEICAGKRRIVVLESVVNPTNIGAIVRSASALSMDAVLFTGGCSDPLYRRAIRVSMGTIFQIPWTVVADSIDWQEKLHAMRYKTVAMALRDNTCTIKDAKLMAEERLAIVLGAEGDGLQSKTIDACDYTACIPMSHGVDSLNVAAASAVAFWQLGNNEQ